MLHLRSAEGPPELTPAAVGEVIERFGLSASSGPIVVGYSGGPDSTALLHCLTNAGFAVIGAHLNHQQRAEGAIEAEHCRAVCQAWGIGFIGGTANVPEIAAAKKMGLEEAGREARYEFLQQSAFRAQAAAIATAHTRTDHIETILMRIFTGTGLSGIAGIPAQRENIIRPLLSFDRNQTVEYCRAHDLWTHEDPSNRDLKFLRPRIRHHLSSEIANLFPDYSRSIERLATLAREESDFLDSMAARALEDSEENPNGDLAFLSQLYEATFNLGQLRHLPRPLLRRAIRLAAKFVGSRLEMEMSNRLVEELMSGASGAYDLPGTRSEIAWKNDRVTFLSNNSPLLATQTWDLSEPLELPNLGATLSVSLAPASQSPVEANRRSLEVMVDAERITRPILVGAPEQGDKLVPLGFDHHRKLSDLISETKFSKGCRRLLPVVRDVNGPIWIPGVTIADRTKVTDRTTRRITFKFSQFERETS